MYLHSQLHALLASLLLCFLLFSSNVDSFSHNSLSLHERRSNEPSLARSVQDQVKEPDSDDITYALRKRTRPAVLDIYDRVTRANQVGIGKFKAFDLSKDRSDAFAPSFCYGCVIVVIGSGKKLLIAHIAEETGKGDTFTSDENYEQFAEGPLEDLMDDNKADLGQRPVVMVFAPMSTATGNWRHWNNSSRMQQLVAAILRVFPEVNVSKEAYTKMSGFSEEKDKADGKVTVAWKAPDTGANEAHLEIYSQDRKAIEAIYLCDMDMWCSVEAHSIQKRGTWSRV